MMADYIRNGRFLALSVALIIVAGASALMTLPRTEDPRVLNRMGMILTAFPGATAQRVEALVSEPIENEMRRLPEVESIASTSTAGFSLVTIELKDSVTETAEIWSRARDHLADVSATLPAGVSEPTFDDDRGYAYTAIIALTWDGPGAGDLTIVRRYAKELQTRLRGIAGTDLVDRIGDPGEEMVVAIDPTRLAMAGLSAQQVLNAIQRADAKVASGSLSGPAVEIQVELAGEIQSEERVRSIPLRVAADGETIYVRDVATVHRGMVEPPPEWALIDGKPGIVVAARMLPDLRVDHWMARVDEVLADFSAVTSANIRLEKIFDQEAYTADRLGGLLDNVVVGFLVILSVLFVTLGGRAALIVALALPLTALFTLACMRYLGLPIHQMSVTGLVVALGIMVDNAIVMVDSIQQRRQEGKRALRAVIESIAHLWLPLAGSTATTILAFAPVALMPGPAGEFVGGIAISVMLSLVGSYLISHTIIAGFAGRFVKPCANHSSWYARGLRWPALSSGFRRILLMALQRPLLTLPLAISLPLAGFFAAGTLTEQFFPPSDRDMFQIEVHLPSQTSVVGTTAIIQQIHDQLALEADIERQHWFVGRNAPSFYYNMLQRKDGSANFGQAMIKARDLETANALIPRLQDQLDRAFPDAQILVRKLEQGPPFNAPVELRIFGPNLDRLAAIGSELRAIIAATPDVLHTRATLEGAKPKVRLTTREETLRQTGLQLTDLADQLQATLTGYTAGSMLEATEELPVRVRVADSARQSLTDLKRVYVAPQVATDRGDFSGLSVAAAVETTVIPARGAISRRDQQRLNAIEAYLVPDVLPQTVLDRVMARIDEDGFTLPAGYRLEIAGESSKRNDAVGNLLANVGIIVALLVLVVVLSFNSFRLSAIIFAVAAQAAGLGLLSVWLFGYPFGFTVIIGLLGLMGLAINAAIVILAELTSRPEAVRGDAKEVAEGVMSCTRHITSTTITTVGGFMPLILAGGGFWPPFAVAIAGGTVMATVLSFFFAPALFVLFARRRSFKSSAPEPVQLRKASGFEHAAGVESTARLSA